jgi:hypothetical protein
MDIKAGTYKAKAVKGSEQYGESSNENKTLQIGIDMQIPALERSLTTFLYFSQAAAPYSFERLRALGWKGNDIMDLTGIEENEVEVSVRIEEYNGKPQIRCDIITGGGGKVVMQNKIDKAAFAARLAAITGNSGGAPPAGAIPPSAATVKPPF